MNSFNHNAVLSFFHAYGRRILRRSLLLSLFLFLVVSPSLGQGDDPVSDEQLAAHYFQKGEYEKAELYYKKLYEKSPHNKTYFQYYIKTLVQLEQFELAEKVIKKRIRRNDRSAPSLYVTLGHVHKLAGDKGKMEKSYEEAIEALSSDRKAIRDLAEAFLEKDEPGYALEVYKKGRKLLRGYYNFNFEMARVYGMMGQNEKMIRSYLDMVAKNRAYMQSVQNALNRALDFDENDERTALLRKELLRRVQRNPGKSVFAEMLIWQYIQIEDFDAAFRQAKAIDRRNDEDGRRVLELARMCKNNEAWETAKDCYNYIIEEKGRSNKFYITARTELLNVMNRMVTQGEHSKKDLAELEKNYEATLQDLGRSPRTVPMMRELAHLKGFYLDAKEEAIDILERTMKMQGLSEQEKARCKIELGDILLLKGDVWDASLYYSQVEKDFKHDPLGHEARFKNAKVSFYTGDFEWAQAQLDVLKASTSKLIANDAMDLSLLITDNYNLDTTNVPMEMYARADLLTYQNEFQEALSTLDSIKSKYPDHSLSDEIMFQKFEIAKKRKKYDKAAGFLERIIEDHPKDILADNAVFELAKLNEEVFGNEERAMELYQKVLTDYSASLYTVEARKRFRKLRGDKTDPPN